MLDGVEREDLLVVMNDSAVMQHLCPEDCVFGEEAHKVAKMGVSDVLGL
jgi:hypothetical protein